MIRLKHISVFQTSKMLAALYAVAGLVYIPFFLLAAAGPGGGGVIAILAFGMPILMGGMGFVFGVIACVVYNFLSESLGGFEFRLESEQG